MKPLHLPSEITATHDAYSTRVNGADKPFEMSLTEMDAYIRRHMPPTKRNSVGLPAFDGMMTALIIDPTPSAPVDVIRVLLAASPNPDTEDNPNFLNFCGAIYARYTHITRSLLASPIPSREGSVFEVEHRLAEYPDAFRPLLSISPDDPGQPVQWAMGFHNVVDQRPAVWKPLTARHPHYLELMHVYYFVPNTRGYPTCKSIRNHSPENRRRYATTGLAADAITAWHHFRPRRNEAIPALH